MSNSLGLIGGIIGPLGPRTVGESGTVAWSNTDIPYDVAIGGIPFNIRPSDDVPYTRQTATFRKQQFDSQAAVGEQSLDGFWRRSQFSFHQGAGVKFYDAFSSDVSARSYQMEGVDPWTPGQVTLGASYSSTLAASHSYAVQGYDGSTSPVVYLLQSDNHLHKWNGSSNTDVAAATSIAVDPNPSGRGYYANGTTVKTTNGGTTVATLSAGTWSGLWWVKERLVGLDNLGYFYEVAPLTTGVTVTQGTGFFWKGNGRADQWVVADAPQAFYLAYGRTIYKIVLSSTGAVPTLTGGIVAAELPSDETVKAMTEYLGFLVIVTSKGPRVAEIASDGSLTYGPRIFDFLSSNCKTIAASGSRVWFTGVRGQDANPRVFTVDLSQQTDDGFAWAVEEDIPLAQNNNSGVVVWGASVGPWDGANLFTAGTAASRTGFIQTGNIRFGTMEPKAFFSVRVKLDSGGGGSVAVSLVRKGGAETLVTDLDASGPLDRDVPLNMSGPDEYIGLKFALVADSVTGDSPVFLGYQLKALPAPERNRLIAMPLLCYDDEKTSHGQYVNLGPAASRLAALEAMEESAGIIVVQDFRIGEQFAAFVEQVQFVNQTPPSRGVSNFGGTVLVTLRKVA